MYKREYSALALLNFIFGGIAICLYLPYTFEAFSVKGFGWLNFAKDVLKNDYYNVLIYFGIFLLIWFIALNLISILSHVNLPKLSFKISIIVALILPLAYVLSLKNNSVLEFWIDKIAPKVKTVSMIFLSVAWGMFLFGLVLNFIKNNRANIHHILQALVTNLILTLLIAVNGWCGWGVNPTKTFGILMSLMAVYLPISVIVLVICSKKRL